MNGYFNGHPDLVVKGRYPKNVVKAGDPGVEIKTTRKTGGAVDTHGARDQWMCVFVYTLDNQSEPAVDRAPLAFTEVYLGHVTVEDFRKNPRSELGTRTATLHAEGIAKLRQNWIYRALEIIRKLDKLSFRAATSAASERGCAEASRIVGGDR